jgi:hypothetical protein
VIIVVGAIVISKRRAHGLGDEPEPASAETGGATAAAISDPSASADAAVTAVPAAHAPDEASSNGHVPTGSSVDQPPPKPE